jgi:hypothetical protein
MLAIFGTVASLSGNHEGPKGRKHEEQASGDDAIAIGREVVPHSFSAFRTFPGFVLNSLVLAIVPR